jgi:hypothetical protein
MKITINRQYKNKITEFVYSVAAEIAISNSVTPTLTGIKLY